ncbi:hypothetical protein KIN20_001784 [Parelaphostrongylus tenuis]|uniref:Uncharacterized protein n=1 Tax=Parelaphostrongylus tenuis TaxID=148309 RepID=A0AAD5LWQ1_PARTN|nr:hypothetical protein KIN20_001784 [Parelaphostrongylus tenuis]
MGFSTDCTHINIEPVYTDLLNDDIVLVHGDFDMICSFKGTVSEVTTVVGGKRLLRQSSRNRQKQVESTRYGGQRSNRGLQEQLGGH